MFLALACAREPAPPQAPAELETVDVTAAPDAALSTAGDAKEARRSEGLSGVLPDGFPPEVPVFRPASLVDVQSTGRGGVVRFDTTASPAAVSGFYAARLPAGGWTTEGGGAWSRAGRRITIAVAPRAAGASITIEY